MDRTRGAWTAWAAGLRMSRGQRIRSQRIRAVRWVGLLAQRRRLALLLALVAAGSRTAL
jgi:hypothetical protein